MEKRGSQDGGKGLLRSLEEAHLKNKTLKEVSDVEWDIRVKDWEKERQGWMRQMVDNSIWAMGAHPGTKKEEEETEVPLTSEQIMSMLGARNLFGLDPTLLQGIQSEISTTATLAHQPHGKGESGQPHQVHIKTPGGKHSPGKDHTPHIHHKAMRVLNFTKHKKMTRLELLQFISDWDKASFGKRDMMIVDFIRIYRTKENVYDSDALFHCGGSLIFCRFTISLQMCFLKHRKVWHYFDALAIFVKSLQGDRYTEEFLRLGGLGFICEVIRIEGSGHTDKLHACKFLVDMMKGRNSIAVKMFICDNPHFLESLVDSLTMCKDKKLVAYCGLCFEHLCLEATIPNVMVVTSYVMRLLPCDFNPAIQSMAFRVLQSVVRLKPSIGARCVKPILDNLKTDDMDLLIEMSNLSQTILQTKNGPDLIDQLMMVAEGIHLREQFKSVFRPHMRRFKQHTARDQAELRKAREKHERVKQKMTKFDHYMQQAGALFVINRMMTNKIEFVDEFTKHGIFGLSLKTLGSSPHWEVQGQGVTMVQFLRTVSVECAISYYLMLPERMIRLIMEKPAECLRYFTSPICILLRKLGRFALRLWNVWCQKVVIPAKELSQDGTLPDYFFEMCKMTRKIGEIQMALQELLENPVMESYSKSDESTTIASVLPVSMVPEEDDESDIINEFISDDDDTFDFRTGKELLFEGRNFKPYGEFLDFQSQLSDDKLDIKVDKSQPSMVLAGTQSNLNELTAYEQTLLQDAEKEKKPVVPTVSATPVAGQDASQNEDSAHAEGGLED